MTEEEREIYQKAQDPNVSWERNGHLDIAVTKTERWKHASPIDSESESTGVRKVRAGDRGKANLPEPAPIPQPEPANVLPTRPWSHTPPKTGRAIADPSDALRHLLARDPDWKDLQPEEDIVLKRALALPAPDLERWLGLRNGRAKVLKAPLHFKPEALLEKLKMLPAEKKKSQSTSVAHAKRLLESAPAEWWGLSAEALRDDLIVTRRASTHDLLSLLPEATEIPEPLPRTLALPWIPALAEWRRARFVNEPDADTNLKQAWSQLSENLIPSSLRKSLESLWGTPLPFSWMDLGPHLLGEALRENRAQLLSLMERPAEPAVYVAYAKNLIRAKKPWSAEMAVEAGLFVEPGHRVAMAIHRRVRERGAKDLEVFASKAGKEVALEKTPEGLQWVLRDAPLPEVPEPVKAPVTETFPETDSSESDPNPTPVQEDTGLTPEKSGTPLSTLPLGAPLTKLLEGAGYSSLETLAAAADSELTQIKGLGPKRLTLLRDELQLWRLKA